MMKYLIWHCLQVVLNSSLTVSPTSGSLVGLLQHESVSVDITGDVDVQEYDQHGRPTLKLLLQGPALNDCVAASQLQAQYQCNTPRSIPIRAKLHGSPYLDQLWIAKKCDRSSLVATLASCGWACPNSDLTCLKVSTAWLTEEVVNWFLLYFLLFKAD